jgi:uncharacterized NAD-dependent epimerase/dehydratase family protein
MDKDIAIVLTNGWLNTLNAKTAHGLLHESNRFQIAALIDPVHAGNNSGKVLNQPNLHIPIYRNVREALLTLNIRPGYCIIGVALHGGNLPVSLRSEIVQAMEQGLSIVSGLHSYLSDDPEFSKLAEKYQVKLIDIRKPRPVKDLRFWTGDIYQVKTPRIALLGMDCAIGKRTTGVVLAKLCQKAGIKTELIYTGQTGWMQGWKYGFIFDATVNDFLAGEIERAILDCDRKAKPDLILIEGQASLRNPAGPCGSEFLLSGNCKAVILQHAPGRKYFEGFEHLKPRIPDIEEEIELIRLFGARTLAVTLNEQGMSVKKISNYQQKLEKQLAIPVIRPLTDEVDRLLPVIRAFLRKGK